MNKILKKAALYTIVGTIVFSQINVFADTNVTQEALDLSIPIIANETIDENSKSTSIFSDIQNHWAKDYILEAVSLGFVSGYPDNTFKPSKTITRTEFAVMLNKALGLSKSGQNSFIDVNTSDWYYKDVQIAVTNGIFGGYPDNTFKPKNNITRQEAAKVIASVLTYANIDGDGAKNLTDYKSIQNWAKPSVDFVSNTGYNTGYPDNTT